MTKRKRVDSAEGMGEILGGAYEGAHVPPECLDISHEVWPFWELVTTAKAKRGWTRNDLILAGDVARCMYRLECLSRELEAAYRTPECNRSELEKIEKTADLLAKEFG
jgi:hypothetical protein